MAKLIQAFAEFGPRVESNPLIGLDEAADWMAMRTGLNKSEIVMVLQELSDMIVYFNRQGTPVKLPGVGIFRPSIDQRGTFRIGYRADSALRNGINAGGAYTGLVVNRERIGITAFQLKELWDRAHPGDPLVL